MNLKTTTAFSKIADVQGNIRIICGASRSSKTYSILQHLILTAVNKSKGKDIFRITICSKTTVHLKSGAVEDFIEILEDLGLYDISKHNKTDNIYIIGKSKFRFVSAEDPTKLRGIKSDVLFINEANLIPKDSFIQLHSRTTICSYLDYNPSSDSYIDEFIEEDKSNFLRVDYRDNEFISPNTLSLFNKQIEKAEAGDLDAQFYVDVFVYGRKGRLPNTIFPNFKVLDKVPSDAQFLGTGIDFGFSSDPNGIVKLYTRNNEIYLEEYLYEKGLLNSQLYNEIIKDDNISNALIVGDSSEPKTITELQSYGLPIVGAVKGAGSIMQGIQLMKEFEIFIIGENIEKEFKNYSWQTDTKGKRLPIPKDNYNHIIDAARYITTKMLSKSTSVKNTLRFI